MQTQTAKRGEPKVLPPKPRKRQEGDPRQVIAFRPPKRLADYLQDVRDKGFDRTAALLDLAEPMLDVREQLGSEWWDLMKIADAASEPVGATIARLVKAGLKKR